MQDKIKVVGEGLPTFTALIKPLPTVNALVLGKVRPAVEGLPTLQALVRPLSCVDHLVLKEMSTLYEGLPTHCTLIGLHSRVDLLMSSKEVFLIKYLPTVTVFEDSSLSLLKEHWTRFLSCPYTILDRTNFPRELVPPGLCLLSFLNFCWAILAFALHPLQVSWGSWC